MARNAPSIGSDNHHGRLRKKLLPIALDEEESRCADRHDQIEFASGSERANVFDEWPLVRRTLGLRCIQRHLVDINRLGGFLGKLSAEAACHIAPRRVGMTERMKQKNAPRLGGENTGSCQNQKKQ